MVEGERADLVTASCRYLTKVKERLVVLVLKGLFNGVVV